MAASSSPPLSGPPIDTREGPAGRSPRGLDLVQRSENVWGKFVRKLAAREKGTVDHWIIWNEQDMFTPALRYTFDGSYEQYAQVVESGIT